MQNSVINLVDLFASLDALGSTEQVNQIVVALQAMATNDAAMESLSEMLEHMPTLNNTQRVVLLLRFCLPTMPIGMLIDEASLSPVTSSAKSLTKPSWDTFAKARPIIIKSNVGVFM